MASALTLGLGLLGAGLAGRVAFQMIRAGKGGAEQFVKGGFKGKMDKVEAMQILGLRYVLSGSWTIIGEVYTRHAADPAENQ
jgi:DnaJ family protein C protein 19